jgi:nitrate/nitrite-specific signal transduction histidine kinase
VKVRSAESQPPVTALFPTIRSRLLISFVLMALLSSVGISVSAMVVGYINGREQAFAQLEAATALKALQIETWTANLQNDLLDALTGQYATERVDVLLDLANRDIYYDYYTRAMQRQLQRLANESPNLSDLWLLDRAGAMVLSTRATPIGGDCGAQPIFAAGLASPQTALIIPAAALDTPDSCGIIGATSDPFVVLAARPVRSREGELLGVIVASAAPEPLRGILSDRTGLGASGEVYLATAGGTLAVGMCEAERSSADIGVRTAQTALPADGRMEGQPNFCGQQVIGMYRSVPSLKVMLAAEQDVSEAFSEITTNLTVSGTFAAIAVLIAIVAAILLTRSITDPLMTLVNSASQIASGNLEQVVPIQRQDEVGTLATAFNSMTAQLRTLINDLDRQVEVRTLTLEQRAVQLETSARVSREITSILDIDTLLERIVELIRAAFDYYHVVIFIYEPEARELTLRASTASLAEGNKSFSIDAVTLNSEAARTVQPVVVNDVSQDSNFRASDVMPQTRAELVIPLKVGGELIGTLDLHSTELNAFSPEDVLVSQSLGDQIAIAIHNARLYERRRELGVLEERNRLARDLHDSVIQSLYSLSLLSAGWRRSVGDSSAIGEYFDKVSDINQQALREMRLLVYQLRPFALQEDGLLGALHKRLETVERRAGVEARLRADDVYELPVHVEEGLYWIVQEALNNSLKHASAAQISVRFESADGQIVVTVTDDGQGFDSAQCSRGLGLHNMEERARALGGSLTIRSRAGEGTAVTVSVPATETIEPAGQTTP